MFSSLGAVRPTLLAEHDGRGARACGRSAVAARWSGSVPICDAGKPFGGATERWFPRSGRRNEDIAVDLAGDAGRSVGAGTSSVGAVPPHPGSGAAPHVGAASRGGARGDWAIRRGG